MFLRLPAELLYQVARYLSTESDPDLVALDNPYAHPGNSASPGAGAVTHRKQAKQALVRLSSTCRGLRSLLSRWVWCHVVIRNPNDVLFLHDLVGWYGERGLPHPLRWVRALSVCVPSGTIHANRLIQTLQQPTSPSEPQAQAQWTDGDVGPTQCRLKRLVWSTQDVPPPPAVWNWAPSITWIDISCDTFWPGDPDWLKLHHVRVLRLRQFDAWLIPPYLPLLLLSTTADPDAISSSNQTTRPKDDDSEEDRDRVEQASEQKDPDAIPDTRPSRSLQEMAIKSSFEPVHLALDLHRARSMPSKRSSLQHLSLPDTQTSLLHSPELIRHGCFANLKTLDVYPATPLPPLAQALASATHLHYLSLTLDVSGSDDHYERLWSDLCKSSTVRGNNVLPLAQLTQLDLDPFPSPSIAPSFAEFLRTHPRVQWVNGLRPSQVLAHAFQEQEQPAWTPATPGDGTLRTDVPALAGVYDH